MTRRAFMLAAAALVCACGEQQSGVMREIAQKDKAEAEAGAAQGRASERFLEEQRGRAGVTATPSGLLYEVTRPPPNASLPRPTREAQVLVHYEGSLANGQVFDSSFQRGEPAQFPLQGVVPGFAEALTLMRPGQEIVAFLPAELGYGEAGAPPDIPPNAALRFRIQLLAFAGPDGRVVRAPGPGAR